MLDFLKEKLDEFYDVNITVILALCALFALVALWWVDALIFPYSINPDSLIPLFVQENSVSSIFRNNVVSPDQHVNLIVVKEMGQCLLAFVISAIMFKLADAKLIHFFLLFILDSSFFYAAHQKLVYQKHLVEDIGKSCSLTDHSQKVCKFKSRNGFEMCLVNSPEGQSVQRCLVLVN